MIEGRGSLGFDFEAVKTFGIVRPAVREDLDGHVALQGCIARTIDLAHPASAQRRDDFIGIQSGSPSKGHIATDYPPPHSCRISATSPRLYACQSSSFWLVGKL